MFEKLSAWWSECNGGARCEKTNERAAGLSKPGSSQHMPEKDPTTWSAATWLLALDMAFGGGAVNWYAKVRRGHTRAAQIEYEADTWERNNPTLQFMWAQLNGTPEGLDDLFALAVTL